MTIGKVIWARVKQRMCLRHGGRLSGSPLGATGRFAAGILGILYPPVCVCCEGLLDAGFRQRLCARCDRELQDWRPACARCARPVPEYCEPSGPCVGCRGKRLSFARTIALGVYGDRLRDVVLRLKQTGDDALTMAVGKLLADKWLSSVAGDPIDSIVPVPMHWRRRLWRGTNPPEVLAVAMGKTLRAPVYRGLLSCRRKTRKQGTLLPSERRQNVRRAYRVSQTSWLSRGYDIGSQHVLVVDDVMTTCATAQEIARTLRQAGARQVSVAVVARGVGFD